MLKVCVTYAQGWGGGSGAPPLGGVWGGLAPPRTATHCVQYAGDSSMREYCTRSSPTRSWVGAAHRCLHNSTCSHTYSLLQVTYLHFFPIRVHTECIEKLQPATQPREHNDLTFDQCTRCEEHNWKCVLATSNKQTCTATEACCCCKHNKRTGQREGRWVTAYNPCA